VNDEHSICLDAPDTDFALSTEDRERVQSAYDVEALEEFLQWVRPEYRHDLLPNFQYGDYPAPHPGMLTRISVPKLQELLEKVWAPYWEVYGTESEILGEVADSPGRHEAIKRLRAAGRISPDGYILPYPNPESTQD
jgi:hypothetical protein